MTVDGSNPVFMLYKNGVLDDNACGTEINHAVTAVGYGSENGKLFYIVHIQAHEANAQTGHAC